MSTFKTTIFAPMWDCQLPLNVNDLNLRPEMKTLPASHQYPTEAIFVVVRSALGDFVRHSLWHLDFLDPSLKVLAKQLPDGGNLDTLDRDIEDRYLKYCNLEIPLHFMTVWTARSYLAKLHLLEFYAKAARSSVPPSDSERDIVSNHSIRMLASDSNLMTSPLVNGFQWHLQFLFPFPAYIHLLQDLKRRPTQSQAVTAWKTMSDNYTARAMSLERQDGYFFTTSKQPDYKSPTNVQEDY
jgi:hypothetical protein